MVHKTIERSASVYYYSNIPKHLDFRKIAVITPKFEQCGPTTE